MNKISLHIHQPGMGLDVLGKLKPPVVTVMDADRDLIVRMRALLPDTHINVRIVEGDGKSWRNVSPAQRANQILGIIKDCPRERLTVEFFNEPLGHDASGHDKAEYDRLLAEFVGVMRASGVEVSGLSLAEGNWTKDGPSLTNDFPKSLDVLNFASLHEYWWPSLYAPGMQGYHWRWPHILAQLPARIKLIISECGLCQAAAGGPDEGWLNSSIPVSSYADDLSQYNAGLVQEPRVLGACVFDAWPLGRFGSFRVNGTALMDKIYSIDAPAVPPEAPPEPEPEPPPEFDYWLYTVKAGDTLSKIAKEFYGDASKYPVIAKFNNIQNPNLIQVGQVLRIPKPTAVPPTPQPEPPTEPPQEELPMIDKIKVIDLQYNERDFDYAKNKYGVAFRRAEVAAGQKVWRLTELWEKTGSSALITQTLGEDGQPVAGVDVAFYWPDAPSPPDPPTTVYPHDWHKNFVHGPTKETGDVGPGMGKGAYHGEGQGGPHAVWVRDPNVPSDICEKLGMLAGTFHDHLDQKFQLMTVGASPAPPQPPTPPEEVELEWAERLEFDLSSAQGSMLGIAYPANIAFDTRGRGFGPGVDETVEPVKWTHPDGMKMALAEFCTDFAGDAARDYSITAVKLPTMEKITGTHRESVPPLGTPRKRIVHVYVKKAEGQPPIEPPPPDTEMADLFLQLAANDAVLAATFLARKKVNEAIAEKHGS